MYSGSRGYAGFAPGGDMPSRQSQQQAQQSQSQQQQQQSLGGAQAPLILNNLAQHLNNPPPPQSGPAHAQSGVSSLNSSSNNGAGAFAPPGVPGSSTPAQGTGKLLLLPNGSAPPAGSEEEKIYHLITELLDPDTRETALLELSKKREMYEDLALVLWGGFGGLR
jgi:CCR4-NOT transcription complex subunit 9